MDINAIISRQLGMAFKNKDLLIRAFTHTSYANENRLGDVHNERLEFLGDAILELVVSEYLYHNFLQWPEGKLTRFRAQLVCEKSLSTLAKNCGFDELLLVGKGAQSSQIRNRPAVLCDVFEAFIGALYLDKGMPITKTFILSQMTPLIEKEQENLFIDYKTLLQEKLQENGNVNIVYTIIQETGPAHDKEFVASVSLENTILGKGVGKSKKEAQQNAAKEAYQAIVK